MGQIKKSCFHGFYKNMFLTDKMMSETWNSIKINAKHSLLNINDLNKTFNNKKKVIT